MRPFSLPKAFQSLGDEQLTELNEWMDDPKCTYDIIRQKLLEKYGIKVSNPTLTRYSQRRVMADEAVDHSDSAKNIRTFIALQNAEPVPYDEAGLAMIQKRAFEAACAPKISVSNLASLQRIFHYKAARSDAEHKKQIAERNTAVREAKLALDRAKLQNGRGAFHPRPTSIPLVPSQTIKSTISNQKSEMSNPDHPVNPVEESDRPCDHLGPLARNWEDIRERARKKFGITPEESARRAELRRTWKAPEPESSPSTPNVGTPSAAPLNIVDFLKDLAADFPTQSTEQTGRTHLDSRSEHQSGGNKIEPPPGAHCADLVSGPAPHRQTHVMHGTGNENPIPPDSANPVEEQSGDPDGSSSTAATPAIAVETQ